MYSRGKKLVEVVLRGVNAVCINEPKEIPSIVASLNVAEYDQLQNDEKLDAEETNCTFYDTVPFEGLSLPDDILVCEEVCILSQPTNEWHEYIISSTDNIYCQ